jgi:hypothetical protein
MDGTEMGGAAKDKSVSNSSNRPHSSYDDPELYEHALISGGVQIQCQFCPGQRFRRSKVRMADLTQILLMRYPVRCLRCSQRQWVSFTVAGISVPSHVRQRHARNRMSDNKPWVEPTKKSLKPKPGRRVAAEDEGTSGAIPPV